MKKILTLSFLVFILSGCASVPALNFSIDNPPIAHKKIGAELKSVTVSLASDEQKKGDISAGMEGIPSIWKSSLDEALPKMAVFDDSSSRKVNLSVKILGLDVPMFAGSMTTKTIASYEIIDRETGKVIDNKEITSSGNVPAGYSFYGVIRARESINRSIKNNITNYLQYLSDLRD